MFHSYNLNKFPSEVRHAINEIFKKKLGKKMSYGIL